MIRRYWTTPKKDPRNGVAGVRGSNPLAPTNFLNVGRDLQTEVVWHFS